MNVKHRYTTATRTVAIIVIIITVTLALPVTGRQASRKVHHKHKAVKKDTVYQVDGQTPAYINLLVQRSGKYLLTKAAKQMVQTQRGDSLYGYTRTWLTYPSNILKKAQLTIKIYSAVPQAGKNKKTSRPFYRINFYADQGLFFITYDSRSYFSTILYNQNEWADGHNHIPTTDEVNNDVAAALRKLLKTKSFSFSEEQ
jgi:hypothetical protein